MLRWSFIATGVSLWLAAGACTVREHEAAPSAVRIVPTELGKAVLLDESGELLAQAVQDHEPTDDEAKLTAFSYSFASASVATGAIDRRLAAGDLEASLVELARQYPKLFRIEAVGETASAAAPLHAAETGTSGMDCNTTCSLPLDGIVHLATVEALKKLAGQVGHAVGDEAGAAIADSVADHVALVDSVSGDAIKKEVQTGSADAILKAIGDVVVTSGSTLKAAAQALGSDALVLTKVMRTASLIGLLLNAEELREALAEAREKQAECVAKRRELGCNEDPACDSVKCSTGEECKTCKGHTACYVASDSCDASDPCNVVGLWVQACAATVTCTGCGSLPAKSLNFEIDPRLAWRGGTFPVGDVTFMFDPKNCELTRNAVFGNTCLDTVEHKATLSDGAAIEASWSCQDPNTNACLCSGETSCVWQRPTAKN